MNVTIQPNCRAIVIDLNSPHPGTFITTSAGSGHISLTLFGIKPGELIDALLTERERQEGLALHSPLTPEQAAFLEDEAMERYYERKYEDAFSDGYEDAQYSVGDWYKP